MTEHSTPRYSPERTENIGLYKDLYMTCTFVRAKNYCPQTDELMKNLQYNRILLSNKKE